MALPGDQAGGDPWAGRDELLRRNAALTEQIAEMAADIDRLRRQIDDRLAAGAAGEWHDPRPRRS